MKLVECVPNFSEGKNKDIINKIADSIKNTAGASLLDIDPGFDTNRTVYTFIGDPDSVVNAAFNAIKTGSELIDMSRQKGAHPRMGACDVCPFIPISDVTMDDCVNLAKKLGEKVNKELGIPVYLYEYAALNPERKNLANIRDGEYEGLKGKLSDPDWKPDFGEGKFTEIAKKSGATVIGAREFLIAYNLNINSKDKNFANSIAKEIREKGSTITNENGIIKEIPGKLKECKAIGWYVEDYQRAQISINLTNYHVTNMHQVFDAASESAAKIGIRITGSEIVGLVPKQAIIESGLYYLQKQGNTRAVSEKEIIDIAVYSLGLSDVTPFKPEDKIIEYKIANKNSLQLKSLIDFTDELASKSPAPGGGSVAALNGSLAASLASMVGNLTYKKKAYKNVWEKAEKFSYEAHQLKDQYLEYLDKDTEAFNLLMQASKDAKNSSSDEQVLNAIRYASQIPYEIAMLGLKVLPLLNEFSKIGNKNAITDIAVGLLNLKASFYAAKFNAMINLKDFKDISFKQDIINGLEKAEKQIIPEADGILKTIESNLH